jgi:hypothetical protein
VNAVLRVRALGLEARDGHLQRVARLFFSSGW